MGIPSLKKHLIYSLAGLVRKSGQDFDKNYIQLLTAAGLLSGKLNLLQCRVDERSFFESAVVTIADMYKEEHKMEVVSENDGFLMLEDARLITVNGAFYQFHEVAVFFDQIIAVTVGELNTE